MAPCEITEDYYAILKIPQTATIEVVRKSYRKLAVAIHPDRNPDKAGATAAFQSVDTPLRSAILPEYDY